MKSDSVFSTLNDLSTGVGWVDHQHWEKEVFGTVSSQKVVMLMSCAWEMEALNCMDESVITPAARVEIFNKHQAQGSHRDLLINLNPGSFVQIHSIVTQVPLFI